MEGSLAQLAQSIEAYRKAEQSMSASYAQSAMREVDADALERQWRDAEARIWPNSMLAKRKIQKLLQAHANHGTADPDRDLPILKHMRDYLTAIDENLLVGKSLPVDGLATDIPAVADILDLANALRDALRLPGRSRDEIRPMLRAVAPSLRGNADDQLRDIGLRLLTTRQGMEAARKRFSEIAGKTIPQSVEPGELVRQLTGLFEARNLLRDWSAWCGARRRAVHNGLEPLIDALEAGTLAPEDARDGFRLAYARWWLPKVLDADPVLRNFRRFQHENAIKEFRDIDDMVRAHAARRVVSAVAHGLPPVTGVARNSELGLLRHQMELQRPSQSIRDMIDKMPRILPQAGSLHADVAAVDRPVPAAEPGAV